MEPITIAALALGGLAAWKVSQKSKAKTVVVDDGAQQKVIDLQELALRAMMSRDPAKIDAAAKELEKLKTVDGDAAAIALHAFADQLRKGTVKPDPVAPSGGGSSGGSSSGGSSVPSIKDASASAQDEAPVNPYITGSSDERVQYARQLATILAKYSKATAGPKTRSQIAAFQKGEGLKADGLYGKQTRAALLSVLTNAGFPASIVPAAYY